MGNVVRIIIQLVSDGGGGLGAGKALPKLSRGNIGDIVAGIVGGVGGGQLFGTMGIPHRSVSYQALFTLFTVHPRMSNFSVT